MIITLLISMYITSTAIMLYFYINAKICNAREGRKLYMPLWYFLYIHFCPIKHTIMALRILNKTFALKAAEKDKRKM